MLNQYFPIIIAVLFAIFAGLLAYKRYSGLKSKEEVMSQLEKDAFDLMQQAEKFIPKEKGYVKFDWVASRFIKFIPPKAAPLFKEQTVASFLQKTYYKFKDKLDNGKVDKSIDYPPEDTQETTEEPEPVLNDDFTEVPNTHLLKDDD
jgi:hypothetical protein